MAVAESKLIADVSAPPLRGIAPIYMLYGLVAIAYWPASKALYQDWTDFRNLGGTHGFLILAVSLWLGFRARFRISGLYSRASPAGVACLFLCTVAWLILWRAGLQDLHLLMIPAILWLAVLATCGRSVARPVLLPIGFLYFGLPAWSHLAEVLQTLTTHAVGFLASAVGVRVFLDGNSVVIPEGAFDIEGGCSGIHYFVVALALAALQGEVENASLKRRMMLAAALAAIAILCNWLRVYTIVMAGHLTEMKHFLIGQHYTFGWVLFTIAVSLFMWFTVRPQPAESPTAPRRRMAPQTSSQLGLYVLTIIVLAAAPAYGQILARAEHRSVADLTVEFPALGGWSGPNEVADSVWRPEFTGAHAIKHTSYTSPAPVPVEAVVVGYRYQEQGAELVGDGGSLLGRGLAVASDEPVFTGAGEFRELRATDASRREFLIFYRYDIGGRQFADPLRSQLWYGLRSLGGAPLSTLIAFGTACNPGCEGDAPRLDAFVTDVEPRLRASLLVRRPRP